MAYRGTVPSARHCIKQGRLRPALGEGSEIPEGATEEAGHEEPRQAGQVPQEIHHEEQHELRAERKCRALLRGALSQSKTHRKPLDGPQPVWDIGRGPGTEGE